MQEIDYNFLHTILGDDIGKYEKASEDDLIILINTLKYTNLTEILDLKTLKDLCYKIVHSKYKKAFIYVLWLVGHLDLNNEIPLTYQRFIYYYLDFGYNNPKKYKEIFKFIESFFFSEFRINYNDVKQLIDSEIEYIYHPETNNILCSSHDLVELTENIIKQKNEQILVPTKNNE